MSTWNKFKILGTLIPAIGTIVGIIFDDKAKKKEDEAQKTKKK